MREFEDADDGLQNPESATYSLPSYTYAHRFDDVLRNGRFSHLLLKKIRQKNANQKGTAAQAVTFSFINRLLVTNALL
ncbi:unnamed protein product [Gongylonema pulchrum]|uniref:Uncharacterized protein n=1 Tax=Gongylonema pulchrum TaxID=637853 RepID=A0A183DYI5_9BILA|nr:unnamed protein product [Gongylonema pulchrum]